MNNLESASSRNLVYLSFLIIGIAESIHRLIQVKTGYIDLFSDAREVWQPAANAVLSGTPLYLGAAADNKPPLWQFLNLLVGSTGHYVIVFTLLVGVANGLAAVLLFRYLDKRDLHKVGILSGFLFLAAIPVVQGRVINVRSFAVLGILIALQVQRSSIKGAGVASASLFSQYGALAGLPILWSVLKENDNPQRDILAYITSGLLLCLFSYSTVHILFGYNSLIGAINNSILLAGSYATEAAKYTLWETPLIWGGGILRVVFGIQYILLPAVVTIIYKSKLETEYEYSMLLSLSVVLSLPLLIRSFQVYWIYPLPFLAALGAMGYEIFFDR